MLDDIILGLKDIKKNKLLFFLCTLICMFTYSIFLSATSSMVREIVRNKQTMPLMTYQVELVGYEVDDPFRMLNNLSSIYQKHNFTFLYTPMKVNNGRETKNVYVILGDVAEHYEVFKSEKTVTLFAGKNELDIINVTLQGINYAVQDVLPNNYELLLGSNVINTNDSIFLVVKNPDIANLIGLERKDFIYYVVANTHISSQADSKLFLEYVNGSFLWVAPMEYSITNNETHFVLTKIYPFLICLIVGYLLMSIIFISYMRQKQLKEFCIYLICGAPMLRLVIRMSTYYAMIFLGTSLLALVLGLVDLRELIKYVLIGGIHYTVIIIIVFNNLKNIDISRTI